MFVYYNLNPNGLTEQDCVCRAISLALGLDYYYTEYLLKSNSRNNDCDMLTKDCYRKILEDRFKIRPKNGNNRRVKDIMKRYSTPVIMRLDGHLSCAINGICFDIWDCTNEVVDEYWVVRH